MDYCDGIMYSIKNGDTLYSISMKYKVPLALLLRANPYVDVYNLQIGETICIPVKRKKPNKPYWYPKGCCQWAEQKEAAQEGQQEEGTVEEAEMGEELQNTPQGQQAAEGQDMAMEQERGRSQAIPESQALPGSRMMQGRDRDDDWDDDRDEDRFVQWKRYVTQPGDTLEMAVSDGGRVSEDDIEDFIDKNGAGRIYLLPGISYYRKV